MIELHIDPSEFGPEEYMARIEDLAVALQRLVDAADHDPGDLPEALKFAKDCLR
jgi:hypothetical protein